MTSLNTVTGMYFFLVDFPCEGAWLGFVHEVVADPGFSVNGGTGAVNFVGGCQVETRQLDAETR